MSDLVFSAMDEIRIKLNAVWWVPVVVVVITWAFGSAICWAQGGWVQELGWFSVKCVK